MNEKYLAIRYIILRLAQEFNIFHSKYENDVKFFNEHNNFSFEKCLLLPYVVTIANGKKNLFLEGVFKNSFLPVLEEGKDRVEIFNVEIEEGVYKPVSIKSKELNLNFEGDKLILKDSDFQNINNHIESNVKGYIDYSIEFFIKRRYEDFPNMEVEMLRRITSENSIFQTIRDNFPYDKGITEEDKKEIYVFFLNRLPKTTFFTALVDFLEKDI
jgi:hypothetical protein